MFEKQILFSAAYDRRSPEPKQNYGIHGVEITFILKGEKGAVQFTLYTNWQLPHVKEELKDRLELDKYPQGWDLGYHSPVPIENYQHQNKPDFPNCFILNGPCFYDGSTLNARPLVDKLISGGDKAIWEELTSFYGEVFQPGV